MSLALPCTLLTLGRSGSRSTVPAAETASASWRGRSCLSQRKCDSDGQISRSAYLRHQEILWLLFSRSKKASGKPKIKCALPVPRGVQPVCRHGQGLPPARGSSAHPDRGAAGGCAHRWVERAGYPVPAARRGNGARPRRQLWRSTGALPPTRGPAGPMTPNEPRIPPPPDPSVPRGCSASWVHPRVLCRSDAPGCRGQLGSRGGLGAGSDAVVGPRLGAGVQWGWGRGLQQQHPATARAGDSGQQGPCLHAEIRIWPLS